MKQSLLTTAMYFIVLTWASAHINDFESPSVEEVAQLLYSSWDLRGHQISHVVKSIGEEGLTEIISTLDTKADVRWKLRGVSLIGYSLREAQINVKLKTDAVQTMVHTSRSIVLGDPTNGGAAVSSLRQINDPVAIEFLSELIDHQDEEIRFAARETLSSILAFNKKPQRDIFEPAKGQRTPIKQLTAPPSNKKFPRAIISIGAAIVGVLTILVWKKRWFGGIRG